MSHLDCLESFATLQHHHSTSLHPLQTIDNTRLSILRPSCGTMFAQPDPPFEPRRLLHFSQSSQPTQSQQHNIPSQPQPTPTGMLADKLGSVTLASQPSRFRPLLSTQDMQMSQVELLGCEATSTPSVDAKAANHCSGRKTMSHQPMTGSQRLPSYAHPPNSPPNSSALEPCLQVLLLTYLPTLFTIHMLAWNRRCRPKHRSPGGRAAHAGQRPMPTNACAVPTMPSQPVYQRPTR